MAKDSYWIPLIIVAIAVIFIFKPFGLFVLAPVPVETYEFKWKGLDVTLVGSYLGEVPLSQYQSACYYGKTQKPTLGADLTAYNLRIAPGGCSDEGSQQFFPEITLQTTTQAIDLSIFEEIRLLTEGSLSASHTDPSS